MGTTKRKAPETVEISENYLQRFCLPDGKSFRPPDGQERARAWDGKLSGFGVVIGKRRISFVVQHRIKGKKAKSGATMIDTHVIGQWAPSKRRGADAGVRDKTMSVAMARDEAIKALGQMRRGIDPSGEDQPRHGNAGGPTLRKALDFHIGKMERGENPRQKVCSPRSIKTVRGSVELHLADYLDRPIVELTADAIETVMNNIEEEAERMDGTNPNNPPGRAAANRIIANVSAIWRSYHKRYGLPVTNPTERLQQRALAARENRINDSDLPTWHAKVLAMENPVRRDLQLAALFCAVRADGLRNLKWEDVNFDEDLIHIARAKGDRPYTLPMVPSLREILERRQRENADVKACPEIVSLGGDAGYVFPSVSRDGERVQAVAEPKERRPKRDAHGRTMHDDDGNAIRERYLPGLHASRKTFNSVAKEIGIPKEARESLMNHEGKGVNVKHYGFPQNWDYLHECAAKIEAALLSRITGEWQAEKDARREARANGERPAKRGRRAA